MSPDQIATKSDVLALADMIRELRAELLREPRDDDWLTIEQAAEKSGRSVDTINRWGREGRIETNGESGGLRRVRLP